GIGFGVLALGGALRAAESPLELFGKRSRRAAEHTLRPSDPTPIRTVGGRQRPPTSPDVDSRRVDTIKIDAWWRAANYLSVGQIYLLDNPLLREPLRDEHVKPRLLGHFGTTPGLNLVYAHLNREIQDRDLNAIYITGPGHGGPGLVANAYLEGT